MEASETQNFWSSSFPTLSGL